MPGSIFVIGSSNTDMVIQSARLPKPGETIIGGQFLMNPGGKGANQAVAAARLEGQVYFVAHVGDDVFGRQALHQFSAEKIGTDFITIDAVHPSGIALINVDANGENCIAVASGANGHLTPGLVKDAFAHITPSDIVLIQLEIPMATVEFVIQECAKRSIRIILNPAPAHALDDELLKHIFLITPNETEAASLTGISVTDAGSIHNIASSLHQKGIPNVVITLGKRGAYWSVAEKNGYIAAPEQKAVDTTAAGDCFNGAMAVALLTNKSIEEAVTFACRAASLSVTKAGAQASMPTLSALKTFYRI